MSLRPALRSLLSHRGRAVSAVRWVRWVQGDPVPSPAPGHRGTQRRSLHRSAPRWSAKLLTPEEMFSRRSLQDYLKKLEEEYEESLKAASSSESGGEQEEQEEELRATRTRLNLMAPLVQRFRELRTKEKEVKDAEALLRDDDPDMRELAALDIQDDLQHIQFLRHTLMELLVPDEEVDLADLVLEVTAGVGGQEAMLFTAEVFEMYQGFAQHQGWSFDVLEYMTSEIGGLRRGCAGISGPCSYKRMKFEAGGPPRSEGTQD
ncbi:Peptide chain release factor 1-like, mitochondrial [Merluccius polli]|uniref:Peptide chain release factor 1-like, mitochondrial n=1 Tax=Merluccius polli TaxID=89951 RepID=A0AA47N3P5_MERPO|nr:Peptide chain release factor 1-like, mitochondrial [Merluccius polli]